METRHKMWIIFIELFMYGFPVTATVRAAVFGVMNHELHSVSFSSNQHYPFYPPAYPFFLCRPYKEFYNKDRTQI